MKKRILSLVLALCMVATMFGGMSLTAKAELDLIPVGWEGNWDLFLSKMSSYRGESGENYKFPAPGTILHPGDEMKMAMVLFMKQEYTISGLSTDEYRYSVQELMTQPVMQVVMAAESSEGRITPEAKQIIAQSMFGMSMNTKNMRGTPEDIAESKAHSQESAQVLGIICDFDTILSAVEGYTAWKILCYASEGICIAIPYSESKDCALVQSGNGFKWYDHNGNLAWNVEETEATITADFTNQCALPASLVEEFNAADKDIKVSYEYRGYTVTAEIPAGKLAVTGEKWYGAAYFAFVNREYVTVKNWFGQEVDIEELFK